MAIKWYFAPALAQLRKEINNAYPNRSKRWDGTIGDAAHAASKSEHNPNVRGCVNAFDIDAQGIDVDHVMKVLMSDYRTWYVIHKRKIYSRTYGWRARPYKGASDHNHHIHISIRTEPRFEQDTRSWGISSTPLPTPKPKPVAQAIRRVKHPLPHPKIGVDGLIGKRTIERLERQLDVPLTGSSKLEHFAIRALKVWLRQPDTGVGIIYKNDITALQSRVGSKRDGVWGKNTTRALQVFLNNNRG